MLHGWMIFCTKTTPRLLIAYKGCMTVVLAVRTLISRLRFFELSRMAGNSTNEKFAPERPKVGEKRFIDDDKVDESRKRVRFVRSHLRNQPLAIKSTSRLDFTAIEHSNDTNGDAITATDELQLQNANRWYVLVAIQGPQ
jgi:hypothetical protein